MPDYDPRRQRLPAYASVRDAVARGPRSRPRQGRRQPDVPAAERLLRAPPDQRRVRRVLLRSLHRRLPRRAARPGGRRHPLHDTHHGPALTASKSSLAARMDAALSNLFYVVWEVTGPQRRSPVPPELRTLHRARRAGDRQAPGGLLRLRRPRRLQDPPRRPRRLRRVDENQHAERLAAVAALRPRGRLPNGRKEKRHEQRT